TTAAPPPFAWTSGAIHADVLLGAGLLATAYAVAWTRGPRGRATQPLRFLAGLTALLAALNGPLHDLSDYYLFSAHMVQHLVLTLVVAPLLLAGTPGWMLDRLLAPLLRRTLGRGAVRLTRPVPALVLYAAALIAWHLPGPYTTALEIHGWHIVEHLVLLATAVLAWWPPRPTRNRRPSGNLCYDRGSMNICVVGTGYVGLVTGAVFADLGNDVVCVDNVGEKIAVLRAGRMPIYEPGLEEMVARNVADGRLAFTTDIADAVRRSVVVFVTVGTPAKDGGQTDLGAVEAVAREIGQAMERYTVVVNKSTVPVGTGDLVREVIERHQPRP